MKRTFALLALLALLVPGIALAQTSKTTGAKTQAILEFFDDETQIEVTDGKGNPMVPTEGMDLPVGTVVKTLKSGAEIRLKPNGSILKLAASTIFQIESLRDADSTSGSNDFLLKGGKIRTVAAKLTNATAPGYNVRTATANCGVRGTDFAMAYDLVAKKDWVCVQEGLVDFTNIMTGATVPVALGQFANTFDEVFQAAPVTSEQLSELFGGLDFVRLDPKAVPGKDIAAVTEEKPAQTEEKAEEKAAEPVPPTKNDVVAELLTKLLGMEVGTVTIDGVTYSKAVLSPVIDLGTFRLGLYLPIVYTDDMFSPSTWYRPRGNDEWSFGSDKSTLAGQVGDFANDLALKIKFLELGRQGIDPFYIKGGNVNNMTIGHGTVVSNFANDQDFPAVRKIGLNGGLKLGPLAIEGLADDIAAPSVVGGRLSLDLIGDQVALGFQAAADLNLANDQDLEGATLTTAGLTSAKAAGDPILMVGGLDLQLFNLNWGDFLRIKAFGDANALVPYYRADGTVAGVQEGFDLTTVLNGGELGSVGGETGFVGNVLFVNYRLSYQVEKGLYTNGLFQGNYYRTRTQLLDNLMQYKIGAYNPDLTMGVFGSADFDLFGFVTMGAAYRWPFELKADGSIGPSDRDFILVRFDIPKGKIPFIDLAGSLTYSRTDFASTLVSGGDLLDAQTVLKGEAIYGLSEGLDLVISVSTAEIRDAQGNRVYEGGKAKVAPTISLDTRLAF